MKRVFLVAAVIGLFVFAGVAALSHGKIDVSGVYRDSLRGSFFSGFLSVGGFLFSLKTFIVIKMKEGLYDSDEYRERHREKSKLGRRGVGLFDPLRNLSRLLFYSIVSSFSTAVAQVTVGLVPGWGAVGLCLSMVACTLCLLFFSLREIKGNLDTWFDCLEAEAKKPAPPATVASANGIA
ncbi:hypothetical protein [Corallococcus sp. CA054B]|uniref:hypothetical protein n=1 Tax=Corallococcus sp. CA054B TaxID=2316734 RepID=UPI0011C3BDD5|nr:hypothetical protein [Corallococcus sp. CA054B]